MLRTITIASVMFVAVAALTPAPAFAQQNYFPNTPPANSFNNNPPANSFGNSLFGLKNPLQVDSICKLVNSIFNLLLVFGIPVATFFLVYAGFRLIIARGNPEALKKARMNLMYVLVGIAIFLGAWVLARVIAATIQSLNADVPGINNCI